MKVAKGIDLLPSGRYRVRVRKGRHPLTDTFATEEEAVQFRNAVLDEIDTGKVVPVDQTSAAQWGPTWLKDYRSGNRGYRSECGRFEQHIQKAPWAIKPMAEVEHKDIIAWLTNLQKTRVVQNGKTLNRTLSFQTRKHVRNLALAMFTDAIPLDYCKVNPVIGIKVRKTKHDRLIEAIPEEWPLKPSEQKLAIETVKDSPERWIVLFAMGTGLRQGETWNLHLGDLHTEGDNPHVYVRFGSKGKLPKNGRARKVPLFGMALEAAREWLKVLPIYAPYNPLGLVFPMPSKAKEARSGHRGYAGGTGRQTGKTPHAWGAIKKAFGTRKVWWHLLRHTCATGLLCGWWGPRWSLEDVAKMLGHSSTKVTERYAHLLDSPLATIAAETNVWWIASKKTNGTGPANAASVQ